MQIRAAIARKLPLLLQKRARQKWAKLHRYLPGSGQSVFRQFARDPNQDLHS
jgi:hypothetical protein